MSSNKHENIPHTRIYRNSNNLSLILNFILFSALPLISCSIGANGNGVDASTEFRKQFILAAKVESSNEDNRELKSFEDQYKPDEELQSKLFASYHESYITEEAARKFRHKMKSHKRPYTLKDYDDILQDILIKPKFHHKNDIYDKKYFDYLPADQSDVDSDDNNKSSGRPIVEIEVEKLGDIDEVSKNEERIKRINQRRFRRFANWGKESENFIQYERKHTEENFINPWNPWNNKASGSPNLNNHYLPPAVIIDPAIYHNTASPPDNPPIKNTSPPSTPESSTVDFTNRIGEEITEHTLTDEGLPIWGSVDIPQVIRRPASTRRPPPPLIHNSDDRSTTRGPPLSSVVNGKFENSQANSLGNNRQGSNRPATDAPLWNMRDEQILSVKPIQRPQQTPTKAPPLGPSQCVWGIVNCCSRNNPAVRYECFEQIGCHGAFWDLNPCSDNVLDAALDEADQFFT